MARAATNTCYRAPTPPTSASPILEQYFGAGPSSDQTPGEGPTEVSRVSRGAANNPRIRGHAHDAEGTGEMGERLGRLATESVHQQAVRGGCLRPRSRAASVTVYEVATLPRHQHGPGTPLRPGDCRSKKGRNPATPLPPPAGPILEQHRGAGSSSDQTTRESQAGVSRISGGAANPPRIRGYAHDPEGTGEMGERFGCSATDSVHPQAVRSVGMRRSRGDSTSRALVAL